MSQTFQELFNGVAGGCVGISLSYPVDSIKTRLQENPRYSFRYDIGLNGWRKCLYSGLPSPLLSIILEKAVLFSSYQSINRRVDSPFWSGIGAGILTTLVVTPFELIKVRSQTSKRGALEVAKEVVIKDVRNVYRGWTSVFLREVPGYGIYFYVYEKARRQLGVEPHYILNPLQSFAVGAGCGMASWAIIFPSDTIKTVSQNNDVNFQTAFRTITRESGWRGLFRGYSWGIVRGGILHGGVFVGYEGSRRLWTCD